MSAHTAGPWQHHGEGSVRVCNGAHTSEEGCRTIAEAEIIGVDRLEAIANARLIAAAPDLLEALKQMVDAILNPDRMSGVLLNAAEAVIAKAEGR